MSPIPPLLKIQKDENGKEEDAEVEEKKTSCPYVVSIGSCTAKFFSAGEIVEDILRGENAPLYEVTQGVIQLSVEGHVFQELYVGEYFGEVPFFGFERAQNYTAVCMGSGARIKTIRDVTFAPEIQQCVREVLDTVPQNWRDHISDLIPFIPKGRSYGKTRKKVVDSCIARVYPQGALVPLETLFDEGGISCLFLMYGVLSQELLLEGNAEQGLVARHISAPKVIALQTLVGTRNQKDSCYRVRSPFAYVASLPTESVPLMLMSNTALTTQCAPYFKNAILRKTAGSTSMRRGAVSAGTMSYSEDAVLDSRRNMAHTCLSKVDNFNEGGPIRNFILRHMVEIILIEGDEFHVEGCLCFISQGGCTALNAAGEIIGTYSDTDVVSFGSIPRCNLCPSENSCAPEEGVEEHKTVEHLRKVKTLRGTERMALLFVIFEPILLEGIRRAMPDMARVGEFLTGAMFLSPNDLLPYVVNQAPLYLAHAPTKLLRELSKSIEYQLYLCDDNRKEHIVVREGEPSSSLIILMLGGTNSSRTAEVYQEENLIGLSFTAAKTIKLVGVDISCCYMIPHSAFAKIMLANPPEFEHIVRLFMRRFAPFQHQRLMALGLSEQESLQAMVGAKAVMTPYGPVDCTDEALLLISGDATAAVTIENTRIEIFKMKKDAFAFRAVTPWALVNVTAMSICMFLQLRSTRLPGAILDRDRSAQKMITNVLCQDKMRGTLLISLASGANREETLRRCIAGWKMLKTIPPASVLKECARSIKYMNKRLQLTTNVLPRKLSKKVALNFVSNRGEAAFSFLARLKHLQSKFRDRTVCQDPDTMLEDIEKPEGSSTRLGATSKCKPWSNDFTAERPLASTTGGADDESKSISSANLVDSMGSSKKAAGIYRKSGLDTAAHLGMAGKKKCAKSKQTKSNNEPPTGDATEYQWQASSRTTVKVCFEKNEVSTIGEIADSAEDSELKAFEELYKALSTSSKIKPVARPSVYPRKSRFGHPSHTMDTDAIMIDEHRKKTMHISDESSPNGHRELEDVNATRIAPPSALKEKKKFESRLTIFNRGPRGDWKAVNKYMGDEEISSEESSSSGEDEQPTLIKGRGPTILQGRGTTMLRGRGTTMLRGRGTTMLRSRETTMQPILESARTHPTASVRPTVVPTRGSVMIVDTPTGDSKKSHKQRSVKWARETTKAPPFASSAFTEMQVAIPPARQTAWKGDGFQTQRESPRKKAGAGRHTVRIKH